MRKPAVINRYKFVIDFDGTISINDSTTMLAEMYIPDLHQKYLREIRNGNISVRKYIKEQLEAIRITKEEYIRTLRNEMQIDLTFKNFLIKNWDFMIVSAGTLQNVFYSLEAKGIDISQKQIISNQLTFNGEELKVEAPRQYDDQENGINKAEVIRNYQRQGYQVVFIGDSISDFEGAKVSDIVYAKKSQKLAKYLKAQNIPFIEYQNFDEIVRHFQRYLVGMK
ncbi:HAD-IB family phosphatase [Enterococcus sp. AZ196]|uniref:HAD-IB family phosphatase n=1 Tax=Enterococcus sp. AZ196 TaxID=2774659 RepID=UPI003D27BB83